jgi:hypothetical protein
MYFLLWFVPILGFTACCRLKVSPNIDLPLVPVVILFAGLGAGITGFGFGVNVFNFAELPNEFIGVEKKFCDCIEEYGLLYSLFPNVLLLL